MKNFSLYMEIPVYWIQNSGQPSGDRLIIIHPGEHNRDGASTSSKCPA